MIVMEQLASASLSAWAVVVPAAPSPMITYRFPLMRVPMISEDHVGSAGSAHGRAHLPELQTTRRRARFEGPCRVSFVWQLARCATARFACVVAAHVGARWPNVGAIA